MSFSADDTIVAIATPPGRGGIGVVRISGPAAHTVACELTTGKKAFQPRYATLTKFQLKPATEIDQVIVTYFPAPHSYTGEDIVEISAHGSPVILRAIVASAVQEGARLAEPGEFTLRAFLNGRIDLTQAEAVADLVDAVTPLQARAAFDQLQGTLTEEINGLDRSLFEAMAGLEASVDFPEEGYHFSEPGQLADNLKRLCERTERLLADARRGRLVREGLVVAIIGKPNVGKSSLFNALVGSSRAIVTGTPGTTRDMVTEVADLDGLQVTFVDTAGLRAPVDEIEAEGMARARRSLAVADLTLVVLDQSQPLNDDDRETLSQTIDNNRLIVENKADLPSAWLAAREHQPAVAVSAVTRDGLDRLRQEIIAALDVDSSERPGITNIRHIALVERARGALVRACDAIEREGGALPEEFVLADLQEARGALEEIAGRRAPEALLEHIFSRFCIGK